MLKILSLVLFVGFCFSCKQESPKLIESADVKAIRSVREQNNKAIAHHDTLTLDKAWMDNMLIISSADSQINGRAALRKLFVTQFNSSPDVIYVRTPVDIQVMMDWGMASEEGTWEGSWTGDDGKIEIGGTYYAKWHKVEGEWRLRTEVYTPTHCKGGTYCKTNPLNK